MFENVPIEQNAQPPVKKGFAENSELHEFQRPNHGFSALPEVVVFSEPYYKGLEKRTNLNSYSLGQEWNDEIVSVVVVRGTWRFYEDFHYKGNYWDLSPGYYPFLEVSKKFSSFQCIEWV